MPRISKRLTPAGRVRRDCKSWMEPGYDAILMRTPLRHCQLVKSRLALVLEIINGTGSPIKGL